MDVAGLLIRFLPVAAELKADARIIDVLSDIKDQLMGGLEHSCYPYVVTGNSCVLDDSMCVLYQEDLKSAAVLCGVSIENVDIPQNNSAFQNTLDIEIMNDGEGFDVLMEYAQSVYTEQAMEKFMLVFQKVCDKLVTIYENPEMSVADILQLS
jgi:hypothetical protein